jgi:3-phenylpropionate/trans-cinnamate dioxygenase ferredoxin subunit
MQGFVKAATLSELPPGKCKAVDVEGVKMVLVNSGGTIHALEDSCSHLGAPLSQGFLAKTSITCEWHGASFDLKTGEALNAPAKDPVTIYEVRIVGDDIEVLL